MFDCLIGNPSCKACWNGLVTRRAVVYIIIRLYKYLGMMGLSVGVNTHSHIKKGGSILFVALSIDCAKSSIFFIDFSISTICAACVAIVPLRSFKRHTLNASAYNVCWYTLCWFNAVAVPLRSFKHCNIALPPFTRIK